MKFQGENIILSYNEEENFIQIQNEDFVLRKLRDDFETSKGASSNIFILHDTNDEVEDRVIKICKSPISQGINKRIKRFKREIRAFKISSGKHLSKVIQSYLSGEVEILDETFLFIILEKAEEDLASYLVRNKFRFNTNQKFNFCINILNAIKQLHEAGIYHRDIKHDNILVVKGEFKIGDLGLVTFQDRDFSIDKVNEKIGPFGWLSPEATNKMLTKNKRIDYSYDCEIDRGSDIFQLGKLFWYVFQGNLPIGQILLDDYEIDEDDLFQVIFSMLQYKKSRRPTIANLEAMLVPLKIKYGA
jgi:serine/threonine protein kinase